MPTSAVAYAAPPYISAGAGACRTLSALHCDRLTARALERATARCSSTQRAPLLCRSLLRMASAAYFHGIYFAYPCAHYFLMFLCCSVHQATSPASHCPQPAPTGTYIALLISQPILGSDGLQRILAHDQCHVRHRALCEHACIPCSSRQEKRRK